MESNKFFTIIPVDKNTYIFKGDPATGKSYFARRIGSLSIDLSEFKEEIIEEFQAKVSTDNHRRMIHPIVVYITNSEYVAKQLELYLKKGELKNE